MSANIINGPERLELRIIRKISKIEVGLVARYRIIASTDKLLEALAFPLINQAEQEAIEFELDRRMQQSTINERYVT
jgi:hypothetical protein